MSKIDVTRQDAQHIAELALSLRNLSFTLSAIADGEQAMDKGSMTKSLFSLHRQVDDLSARLMELSDNCRTCIDRSGMSCGYASGLPCYRAVSAAPPLELPQHDAKAGRS